MRSLASHLAARESTITALEANGEPAEIAAALEGAAQKCRDVAGSDPTGASEERWAATAGLFSIAAAFYQWDAAVTTAEPDADRYLRSAQRQAERLQEGLSGASDPTRTADLIEIATRARALDTPAGVDSFRQSLKHIQLPLTMIPGRRRGSSSGGHTPSNGAPTPIPPRAILILLLDRAPLDDVVRVKPDRVHRLGVIVRVLNWPAELPVMTVRFTSVWATNTIEAAPLELHRPGSAEQSDDDVPLAVEGEVELILRARDEKPFRLAPQVGLAEASGGAETEIEVLGHRTLGVRAFDPVLDPLTGAAVVDERLHGILEEVSGKVQDDEFHAFTRFITVVARAATALQFENLFRKDQPVREDDFQEEMERRLRADPTLEGRLERNHVAGGITDLVHDGVTCELKVVPDNAVTIESASDYIGQPVQYASGRQRQLSLLCILDMSPKDLPPGVLPNNIALIEPEIHGAPASHPSWVAVVIISGNFGVPSSWSGRQVPSAPE